MTEIKVSVRDLVTFCHRRGDIDHRYTPSPTAAQGIAGHSRVYRRRGSDYQSEYPVSYRYQQHGLDILLRGRADGYDPAATRVEEIKTCRGDPARIPAEVSQLHLAQARIYAALIAGCEALDYVDVRLTWLDIDADREHHLDQRYTHCELQAFLQATLQQFSAWLALLARHRRQRQASLQSLCFPYGDFRPGQRDIAELVYKCIDQGGELMVEAPTGIGKTAAVLYPALKAMGQEKHEAIVFVTSRTVGRRTAEDSIARMTEGGLCATSLSLSAKESVCLSPGSACHGDDCPYARGYYDRLQDAMVDAVQAGALQRDTLQQIARTHTVCPYQLATDLLPWVDIVIADAHYVFSLQPLLAARPDQERRWTVLLDEAHNLPERARKMYSASVTKAALMRVRKPAKGVLKQALDKLNKQLLDIQREDWGDEDGVAVRTELPADLVQAMTDVVAAVAARLTEDVRFAPANPALMDFFFALLQWLRVAEQWGDDYRLELARGEGRQGLGLGLNCLDPSRLLARRHEHLHALVIFSATLSPRDWMRQLLGLRPEAVCRRLDSPFQPQQLEVMLETRIDTRFRQRSASAGQLVARLERFLTEVSGNCIVYFSSYQYLRTILDELTRDGGPANRQLWQQHPGMDEASRESLFTLLASADNVAAFCILGGVFSEGIDLPGRLLSGVAVVGVGLPQVARERELLRDWYEQAYGSGFEYAYIYPAMQKVDQALGRVVRTNTDRGVALLIDERYGHSVYQALLPPWWAYQVDNRPQ